MMIFKAGIIGMSGTADIGGILLEENIIITITEESRFDISIPCVVLDYKLIFVVCSGGNWIDDGKSLSFNFKFMVIPVGCFLFRGDPHCVGSCVDVTMLNFNGCS